MTNKIHHLYSKLEFNVVLERLGRYATSEPGRKLIREVIPFTNYSDLQLELSLVSEAKRVLETEDSCPLDGIKDITRHIHKALIEDSFISAPELYDVLTTQRAARLVRHFFAKRSERYPRLWNLCEGLFVDRVLEYNIEGAIDEESRVKDSASKELREIRRSILLRTEALRTKLEEILKNVSARGYAQEEIITTRDGRMVIPVKVEHKHHVPGFIHSSSASGATVFIEPTETLEMNNEIRSLHFSEQREIERILRLLTAQVRASGSQILQNLRVLARLDFLFAKAKYSIEVLGAQPVLTEGPPLHLFDARHPILLMKHNRDEVVPLTLELGKDYNTLLVTGPNAGGKTVALKTVGLLCLMTSCGLHIPASADSWIPLFHNIFVDIGDEQSIENDLSSFSSRLLNLKQINEEANEHSLILLDEIGAGTDPAEGGAIAAAFLKSLTDRGSLTVATTHHGELKAFAHETPGFANGSMEFDQETLRPTYRFRTGIPGSSYALEIAQRLGLPAALLALAREYLGNRKDRLEHLLAATERRAQILESELLNLDSRKSYLTKLIQQYETKLQTADKEIREKKLAALEEAERIILEANKLIESSIKEIKEKLADHTVVRRVKQDVTSFQLKIQNKLKETRLSPSNMKEKVSFAKGDYVKLREGTAVGEVVEVMDDGRTLLVEFGSARLQVNKEKVLPAEREEIKKHTPYPIEDSRPPKREIDLRGMSVDEAIRAVEKFLDDATIAGLSSVHLIHGKGTGTLRKRITEYLKKDSRVQSSRLGNWNEGGSGVTVVELKA